MGRSFFIILSLIAFLSGVLLYLWIPSGFNGLIACIFLSLTGLVFIRNKTASQLMITGRIFFLFILFFSFGLLRASFTGHFADEEDVDFYNEAQVELQGVIIEADIRRDQAKYKLEADTLTLTSAENQPVKKIKGKVLINLDKFPPYEYGDRVRVTGRLEFPGEFNGFSYQDYLSRYGIYSVMYRPRVYLIEKGQGNLFWKIMVKAQSLFMKQINLLFPEPFASFEAGLLVGARKGIAPDLMEQFNITGLTHIIAISGYNITLIIIFVMAALKGVPRRLAFITAILAIVLFTVFVGASPAVVRASIMGILGLIALQFGRQNNIHITILFSAAFMVFWNPKILWWDVGFQLSFMAVMGLIYVAPLMDHFAKYLPEFMGIRESIQMTLAAQVMALPIIVFNFERLSLIAPLANLLVAFALPLAMLFGFIAVILSFFLYHLALGFAYITSAFLAYIIFIIEWMAKVPYASVDISGMRGWMLVGYYFLLGLFLWGWNKQRSEVSDQRSEVADQQ